MNVRASIILEEKTDTMAVLYDAVGYHPETGEPVIFVAQPVIPDNPEEITEDFEPVFTARMIPIVTGMETDLHWEISGELKEGDLVLQDPAGLYDGMIVTIDNAIFARRGAAGPPGGGGGGAVRIGGGGGGATVRVR
jgi:hypothetical protein